MPFSKQAINFLNQNSASIGRLFNLQEHKDFLLQFVTPKEIQKFLKANETNSEQVENMISFIKLENHNRLYNALIDRLKKIHKENGQFVNAMLQTCEGNVDERKDDTMIVTHKYKMEKELMNSMKEILSDMKIICEENQKLKIAENNERESRGSHKITNEILSKEVMKLNAETKRLNSELSQSLNENENLEIKVAELLSLQEMKHEQSNNVELRPNQPTLEPVDSDEAATALTNKGAVHYNKNEFKEALNYFTQALEMRRRLHSGDHEDIAVTLSWIGLIVHYNQNEFNAALDYHTQALEMCQRLHNGDHFNIALYLYNIAMDYYKLQQWNKSLEYHNKCLQMRRRLHSGDHVDIAVTLNEIGLVHYNQNKLKEALDYFTQALKMRQRLYNGEHVDIAWSLHNIACVHERNQDLFKSLDCFTRCLEMRRQLYPGGDHVDVKDAAANVDRIKKLMNKK